MLDRRTFVLGSAALILARGTGLAATAPFKLDPRYAPHAVLYPGYPVGTIVVDTPNHFLYFVSGPGVAIRYGVAVGRHRRPLGQPPPEPPAGIPRLGVPRLLRGHRCRG